MVPKIIAMAPIPSGVEVMKPPRDRVKVSRAYRGTCDHIVEACKVKYVKMGSPGLIDLLTNRGLSLSEHESYRKVRLSPTSRKGP